MVSFAYVLSVMVVSPVVAQFAVDDWHDPQGPIDKTKAAMATMKLLRHATHTKNPLLQYARFPGIKPPFDKVKTEHTMGAINQVLEDSYQKLKRLEKQCEGADFVPTGQTLVDPAELLSDELDTAWSFILHMSQVSDSEDLRVAVRALKPKITEFNQAFAQSVPIYQAFKKLKRGPYFEELAPSQKRIVLNMIRDLKLGGAELAGIARERFNYNAQKLAELSQKYSENVIDSRNEYQKVVTNEASLAGLPKSVRRLLALNAKKYNVRQKVTNSEEGPWLITLDSTILTPVLMYCKSRKLRKELYLARIGLASDLQSAKFDNGPIAKEILALRQKQAKLLGYESYGHLSLSKKMANSPKSAENMLTMLAMGAQEKAKTELENLESYAKGLGEPEKLKGARIQPWDVSYYGAMQKNSLFKIDSESLRQYFPLEKVLNGMFLFARRLFGVRVSKVKSGVPTWHPDVQVYLVQPDKASDSGILYMDLFARPGKRGGAWTSNIRPKAGDVLGVKREQRTAVASINTNFRPPEAPNSQDENIDPFQIHTFANDTNYKMQAHLSFEEVHTLFHEFGHVLQHMLSTEEDASVSGLHGIEYDALETASQFMDYWLDDGPSWVIKSISTCSEEENECDKELGMLKDSMKYHRGMDLLGQAHLALVDLDLHTKPLGKTETLEEREQVIASQKQTRVLPQLEEDRHLNSFSHIFAGNDAAGYYSHKWAEVLAADTFAAFEDTGAFKPGAEGDKILSIVGKKFADTILAHGGGRHPAHVFKMFRQREPTPQAFLRYLFGRDTVAGEGTEEPLQLDELQDVSATGRRLTDL